jgi:hypothetical protein
MDYTPYKRNWVTVYCPVCKELLGQKKRVDITAFECQTEGCSKTKHWFYPGQAKRPKKSIPWAAYHEKNSTCGCLNCQPKELNS